MRLTRCGTCGNDVDRATHRDAHNPKSCRECHRELPVGQFPRSSGAGDGRRHTCNDCTSMAQQVQSADRGEQHARDQRLLNERLREHGYRWVRCQHPQSRHGSWDLLDPRDALIDVRDAERQVAEVRWNEVDQD